MNAKNKTRQIAFLGIMIIIAFAASYVERMIPPPIPTLPGIKLGLANVVILMVLYLKDAKTALTLNIMRIFLFAILFSGLWGMFYSLFGALFSFTVICLLKKAGIFGVVGVSVGGGVFHNVGQICFAMLSMQNISLIYYLPLLIFSGIAAGILVGYGAGLCANRLKKAIRNT